MTNDTVGQSCSCGAPIAVGIASGSWYCGRSWAKLADWGGRRVAAPDATHRLVEAPVRPDLGGQAAREARNNALWRDIIALWRDIIDNTEVRAIKRSYHLAADAERRDGVRRPSALGAPVAQAPQDPRAGSDAAHPRTSHHGDDIVSTTLDGMSIQQLEELIQRAQATKRQAQEAANAAEQAAQKAKEAETIRSNFYQYHPETGTLWSVTGAPSVFASMTVNDMLKIAWNRDGQGYPDDLAKLILRVYNRDHPADA